MLRHMENVIMILPSLQQHHCVTYNHKALVKEMPRATDQNVLYTQKHKVNGIKLFTILLYFLCC